MPASPEHWESGWNPLLEGDDAGVFSVAETRLDGASQTVVVRGLHTFLMANEAAIEATVAFLAEDLP